MKRIASVIALACLTGCANYDALRASAPRASQYELCRAGWLHGDSTVRQIAVSELGRRGQDCSQWAAALAQERAANAQTAAATMQMIRAMQPPPPAPMQLPPPPVHCTSYNYGNQVQTTCR